MSYLRWSEKKNPKTLADFNRLKSYSAMVYFRHLRNFASHKDANFLTIQNVSSVKGRSYIMEFGHPCITWFPSNFHGIWKLVFPLRRFQEMIRSNVTCCTPQSDLSLNEAPQHDGWHKAQHTGTTTLSLLRCAVPTKPALHPRHVNPIHGISTASFMLPLALPPM